MASSLQVACFSRCKKKSFDGVCSMDPIFYGELKKCINESDTIDVFEERWGSILDEDGLRENTPP